MSAKGKELIAESGDRPEVWRTRRKKRKGQLSPVEKPKPSGNYTMAPKHCPQHSAPWRCIQTTVQAFSHCCRMSSTILGLTVSQKYFQLGYVHRISLQVWNTLHPQQVVSQALTNFLSIKCGCGPPWTPHRTNKLSPSHCRADLRFSQIWYDMIWFMIVLDIVNRNSADLAARKQVLWNSLNLTAWYMSLTLSGVHLSGWDKHWQMVVKNKFTYRGGSGFCDCKSLLDHDSALQITQSLTQDTCFKCFQCLTLFARHVHDMLHMFHDMFLMTSPDPRPCGYCPGAIAGIAWQQQRSSSWHAKVTSQGQEKIRAT